jgi:hypothetical protein
MHAPCCPYRTAVLVLVVGKQKGVRCVRRQDLIKHHGKRRESSDCIICIPRYPLSYGMDEK